MNVSRRGQKTIGEERTVERRRKCKFFVHKRIALPPLGGAGDGREGELNDSSHIYSLHHAVHQVLTSL